MLQERLERAFDLTFDLYSSLDDSNLSLKISNHPSNTIGSQVWCIIGARESYFKAIKNFEWKGFSCSLKDDNIKLDIVQLLKSTNSEIMEYLDQNQASEDQIKFAFALFEHEIQHHGQLIRYFYANRLKFPDSWKKRYTV